MKRETWDCGEVPWISTNVSTGTMLLRRTMRRMRRSPRPLQRAKRMNSLSTISASDCLRDWAAMADGKDGVNDIAAFLTGSREAPTMTTGLRLRDGRRLRCRMVELAGGAVMASFDPAAIGVFPTRKLRQRLRVTDPT